MFINFYRNHHGWQTARAHSYKCCCCYSKKQSFTFEHATEGSVRANARYHGLVSVACYPSPNTKREQLCCGRQMTLVRHVQHLEYGDTVRKIITNLNDKSQYHLKRAYLSNSSRTLLSPTFFVDSV